MSIVRLGCNLKFFSKKDRGSNASKATSPVRKKLTPVDFKDYHDVQSGDRITIRTPRMTLSGLTVEGKNRLYVERSLKTSEPKVYLDQLEERGESIDTVLRYVPVESSYTPKEDELDSNRPGVKIGSRASLEQAVEAAEYITTYFENRIELGDPLFDQWMVDALDSSREASKSLRLTIDALHGSSE